jgi:hypothetical protein
MSVSISTPHSDVPSIHSDLETAASRGRSEILGHDMNRLLQYLHELNQARGQDHEELAGDVRAIRDELGDLSDYLHTRDIPPPVPQKDLKNQSIGGASVISSDRPLGPRGGMTPMSLSPPPMAVRAPASPSSIQSGLSWLSSHDSDDYSLMESEPYPVPWQQPQGSESDSSSSPPSSPREPPSRVPPLSPVPSVSSSEVTVRDGPSLRALRDILDAIRNQTDGLRNEQVATNRRLDGLAEPVPELNGKLNRLEDLLQNVLEQIRPREGLPPVEPPVSERPESFLQGSDMSDLDSLRRRWDELTRARQEQQGPAQPTPVRPGPNLNDMVADMLAAGPQIPPPGVLQPPPLALLVHQPFAPHRGDSPFQPTDLPIRPATHEPVDFREGRPHPSRTRRQSDRSGVGVVEADEPRVDAYPFPHAPGDIFRRPSLRRRPPVRPVIVGASSSSFIAR